MPRPSIDADVEGIGGSHRLRRISAILPDQVEKRLSPRIAGEETVQVAAERAPVAPAELGASPAHERLALLRDGVAAPVADLVAPQVEPEHGPGAHRAALLCPLLRFEDGGDGQQAEPRPRAGPTFAGGRGVRAAGGASDSRHRGPAPKPPSDAPRGQPPRRRTRCGARGPPPSPSMREGSPDPAPRRASGR